tara:strand:+ start:871 stop:1107 length:237 start_codon:yes stop_codon:yes gene_type:complete
MMFILNILVWYLALGCIFTILVDISTEHARKKGIEVPDNDDWNNETRVIAILVWPLGLLFFLDGFIRSYYNKNNKNNK